MDSTGLVGISIVQPLGGLVAWFIDSYHIWVTELRGGEALILLLGAMVLSSKIWADMSVVKEATATKA